MDVGMSNPLTPTEIPTMRGTLTIPFSTLFADTIGTHGVRWAHAYYTRRGMSECEFGLWFRVWAGRIWEGVGYYA